MAYKKAPRGRCPTCGQNVAITQSGLPWAHGTPRCPPAPARRNVRHSWPRRHRGRRVVTVPGPDTWNPTTLEGAA